MLAGVCQSEKTGHLARCGRQVNGTVRLLGQVEEFTIRTDRGRSEVAVHLAACRHGLPRGIGVRVELGEIFLDRQKASGHHQRLIPIVTTAEITGLELPRERELRDFLAVSEDAEFGLARQDLLSSEKRGFPADAGELVIVEGDLAKVITGFKRESLSHEVDGAARRYRRRRTHSEPLWMAFQSRSFSPSNPSPVTALK